LARLRRNTRFDHSGDWRNDFSMRVDQLANVTAIKPPPP
jgi:hypothetical protein